MSMQQYHAPGLVHELVPTDRRWNRRPARTSLAKRVAYHRTWPLKRSETRHETASYRPKLERTTALAWHAETSLRIESLAGVRDGWDGDDGVAPSYRSIQLARFILGVLFEADCAPSRVVATRQGGISFIFFGREKLAGGAHARYASLTAHGEGELSLARVDRNARSSAVSPLEETAQAINEALTETRQFLDQ